MCMPYSPLFGVKVIGSCTEIVDESEGQAIVGHDDIASGTLGRERDGLATEVGEGGLAVKFLMGEGVGVEGGAHGEGVLRNEFLAFLLGEQNAGGKGADSACDG